MKVNEIFKSLSGEGKHCGVPTVFVRLQGCPLECKWCDTEYARDAKGGKEIPVGKIVEEVKRIGKGIEWILITGGEPLMQEGEVGRLVARLWEEEYKVEIETNGFFLPPLWVGDVDCWSVDIKCPSSGECGKSKFEWFKLWEQDQIKFVVGSKEDMEFVKGVVEENRKKDGPEILVSPASGVLVDKEKGFIQEYWRQDWLQEVWEFCVEERLRLSLQVHKITYGNRKGV